MSNPVIVVIGTGPGLGAAIARRFGADGYDVALVARDEAKLAALGRELQDAGVTAGWSAVDVTDDNALRAAIERFGQHAGHLDVLHFNPSAFRAKNPLELTPDELLADLRLGIAALLTAVQAARPFMSEGARISATGSRAAAHPWAGAASLGVQKAGLANLVSALDQTLAPEGIRAVTLVVNGTLAVGTAFDPGLIADTLVETLQMHAEFWQSTVVYNGR